MTNIKRIALCELSKRLLIAYGKPAKYLRDFTDPKAKPQHLCGIHANSLKKRGIKVRSI